MKIVIYNQIRQQKTALYEEIFLFSFFLANQLLHSGKKDEPKTNITLKVPTEIKHSKVTKAKINANEEDDIKTDINL